MVRGIHTAAAGMNGQQHALDVIANNLANVSTPGFKQDVPAFADLHVEMLRRYSPANPRGVPIGSLGHGSGVDEVRTDLRAGAVISTRSNLDMALLGEGYFTVQTARGERYTRDGHFRVAQVRQADGSTQTLLTDARGNPVLGESGPIEMTSRDQAQMQVREDGTLLEGGKPFAKLLLRNAPTAALRKEGDNLLAIVGTPAVAAPRVQGGALEQSNVNAVASMVKMISVQRAYEAMQKAIVAQDETLGKVVNEVGRV